LILRFFALFERTDDYERPMTEFLNRYMRDGRVFDEAKIQVLCSLFERTVAAVSHSLGERPFRPERNLNAAVFDSVMVGLACRLLEKDQEPDAAAVDEAYRGLLGRKACRDAYVRSTSDTLVVKRRVSLATKAFANV